MGNFDFQLTSIPGVLIIKARRFSDERGYFMEAFQQSDFATNGLNQAFVQDNLSVSKQGVLRGLHYQLPPKAQGKLVRAVKGKIWDVAVDIQKSSPTFKQWVGVELSENNGLALYLPPGFAHGFIVLSEEAVVYYKATDEYDPSLERGIKWDDPELNISWPIKIPVLSAKDKGFPVLSEAEIFN